MRIEAVIFDVDGTIWDSAERVAESWTEAFSDFPETKGIEVSAGELASYMGLTMETATWLSTQECFIPIFLQV